MHFLVCIQIPDFAKSVSSTTLPNMWEVKLGWKAGNSRKATPGLPVSVQLLYSLRLLVSIEKSACFVQEKSSNWAIIILTVELRCVVHTLFFQLFWVVSRPGPQKHTFLPEIWQLCKAASGAMESYLAASGAMESEMESREPLNPTTAEQGENAGRARRLEELEVKMEKYHLRWR